ncbi:hypothetical protein DIPPA_09802 [Diplonema papillatum]|nr:hypothetical protein DIPPA_09802 [Diplonema papillatum]
MLIVFAACVASLVRAHTPVCPRERSDVSVIRELLKCLLWTVSSFRPQHGAEGRAVLLTSARDDLEGEAG